MAQIPYLLADPDRVGAGFHRNPARFEIAEALIYTRWVGPEPATVDDLAVLVEGAVMAPDVSKVDTDRRPGPGTSAWTFEMKYCG